MTGAWLIMITIVAVSQPGIKIPTDGSIGEVWIMDGTETKTVIKGIDGEATLRSGQLLSIEADGPALENLATIPGLPVVQLSIEERGFLSHNQLAGLQKLRSLQKLWIQCPTFGDEAIEAVGATNTLQVVNLLESKVTDAGCKSFSRFTNLTTLKLAGSQITDRGISTMGAFCKLETVVMPPLTTDSGLTLFVGNNKEIKSLSLSKTKVTDRGLSCLNQLPHLESLIVRETSIGDTGVVSLVRINSLITLDLSNTGITDAVFQFLGSLKNLETLDLSYTKVTGKDLSELAETKLKYLSLDFTCVNDNSIPEILNIGKLRSISLLGTRVTDLAIRDLVGLKHLESIELPVHASDETANVIRGENPTCQVFLTSDFAQRVNPGSDLRTNDSPCGPESYPSN